MINGELHLDFDQQDALILQLQASFEDICPSEQSDVFHSKLNIDLQIQREIISPCRWLGTLAQ